MDNVIGFKSTATERLRIWLSLLESKKTFNTLKNSLDQQELNIADVDKRVYDYYLSKYVKQEAA